MRTGEKKSTNSLSELERAEEEIRRLRQELESFAFAASHDLQEPLRAVTGFAQILQRSAGPGWSQHEHRMLGLIVGGAKQMSDMIEGLLLLSRIGSKALALEKLPLEKTLVLALSRLSAPLRESQAVVRHDALPTLTVDASHLSLLFQNLLSNSIKFCRDRAPEIHVGATSDGKGWWTISVRDNGLGIEPKYFDRIFGVFQRLHAREEYPGTGLGLALCKKIVERHGGRIWLESVPREGTIFHFTLPENHNAEEK